MKSAIKMSSAILKKIWFMTKISSVFFCNMSPTGDSPNFSHVYLYLPNRKENGVLYGDLSSNFKL